MARTTLEALGLSRLSRADDAVTYAALISSARRLLLTNCQAIGLLPAAPNVAVPALGIDLALALAAISGGLVGVADVNVTWPAFPGLPRGAETNAPVELSVAELEEPTLGGTVVLTSPVPSFLSTQQQMLERSLAWHRARHAHFLVDLTGLDLVGEHLDAFNLVDGVVLVIRSGLTSETQILAMARQVPRDRNLGAIVFG